jgi:hypothetical protein
MKPRGCMGWGFVLLLGFLVVVWLTHRPEVIRYKMTVEVDTPSGPRSGFAVREASVSRPLPIPLPGESHPRARVRGEAVAVDVAPGKALYALLAGANGDVDYGARVALEVLRDGPGWFEEPQVEVWPRAPVSERNQQGEPLAPLLVTFADPADPKSVLAVDPDNLAASFGPGVTLKRVTVEITDDEVTTGIEKRLAMIGVEPNHGLDRTLGVTTKPTLAQQLGYGDFRR